MRKIRKKIITVSDLYIYDEDTRAFICEEVQFFWITKDKFPNFLHELAYKVVNFIRHLKNSQYVLYWV